MRRLDVVLQVPVLRIGDIADAQQPLDLFPSRVGNGDGAMLFVDHEVAGQDLVLAQTLLDLLALLQLRDDAIDLVILVGRFLALSADDERGTRFVDQDGVHFVDDGEVMAALHAIVQVELHVVAQVVEAELVIGAVGDVGSVSFAALHVVQIMHDDAHAEAEEGIELAHPLRVALGQVIVHRDHVNAAAGKRIEVYRQGSHQRFTFTGLHFGDLALVQHDAAHELHVEVAHLQHAPAAFAHHREGLGQNLVEYGFQLPVLLVGIFDGVDAFANALAELLGLGAQLIVGELFNGRLERVDLLDQRHNALDFAFVTGAENLGDNFVKQCCIP